MSSPRASWRAERVLDERIVRFGVRSITRDDDWTFSLNGRRIYLRGTNYIATQWLSQADRAFYARDLRLMVDANLNSIRVHAHLERPEFYDLADEMGILVWQDFPLQWGYTDTARLPRRGARARRRTWSASTAITRRLAFGACTTSPRTRWRG